MSYFYRVLGLIFGAVFLYVSIGDWFGLYEANKAFSKNSGSRKIFEDLPWWIGGLMGILFIFQGFKSERVDGAISRALAALLTAGCAVIVVAVQGVNLYQTKTTQAEGESSRGLLVTLQQEMAQYTSDQQNHNREIEQYVLGNAKSTGTLIFELEFVGKNEHATIKAAFERIITGTKIGEGKFSIETIDKYGAQELQLSSSNEDLNILAQTFGKQLESSPLVKRDVVEVISDGSTLINVATGDMEACYPVDRVTSCSTKKKKIEVSEFAPCGCLESKQTDGDGLTERWLSCKTGKKCENYVAEAAITSDFAKFKVLARKRRVIALLTKD